MQQFTFKILREMYKATILFILLISLNSCRDFFEKDLENENITIITPSNNAISTNLNITFDWDDLEGTTNYRFLIGSPNLGNPSSFYMDSTLDLSNFLLSLNPGEYEWKVRGQNNSSESNYSISHNLTIDSSYNLNSQSIVLYTPINNYYINSNIFSFTWQELYSAENYNLVIKQGNDWNTGNTLLDSTLTATTIANPLVFSEGSYTWAVKAQNTLPSETIFSNPFIFNIDLTSPNSANLNFPNATTNNLNTDSLYLFDWSRAANNGTIQSSLFDSIFIYLDTIQDPISSYGSLQEDTSLTLPNSVGNYYWNVKTYDKAGNNSSFTYFKRFTVI